MWPHLFAVPIDYSTIDQMHGMFLRIFHWHMEMDLDNLFGIFVIMLSGNNIQFGSVINHVIQHSMIMYFEKKKKNI